MLVRWKTAYIEAVIGGVRFRKALMYAPDRQQLMDTLQGGFTGASHVYLNPSEPEFRDVENSVVRYDYDPRRAAQMLQELSYTRGADGLYRDGEGQRLALEMRTYAVKVSDRATVVIADEWSRFGISTEPVIIPPQRIQDREYMATFPGFLMYRQPNDASGVGRLRGSLAPTAENRFVGSNYARYLNPEFDTLIDRFLSTVPRPERIELLRQIVYHISDQVNLMGPSGGAPQKGVHGAGAHTMGAAGASPEAASSAALARLHAGVLER